jgi:hypothetical protein
MFNVSRYAKTKNLNPYNMRPLAATRYEIRDPHSLVTNPVVWGTRTFFSLEHLC